ncbi:MAG: response regulator, partial [Bacteroidota bacterium]
MSAPDSFYILIVEDDPLVRADLADCLEETGYVVIGEAGNKADALATLQATEPDLVLLDIHLEKGQEGIEIAHEINAQYLIPFIYLTALIDAKTLVDVSDTLPAGFVVKPFDEGRLKAAIEIARRTYYAVLEPHWRRQDWQLQHLSEPLTQRESELLNL